MDKGERKRLEILTDDANNGKNQAPETLTRPDLLLLLREDKTVRALIRDIVAGPDSGAECHEKDASARGEAYDEDADKRSAPPLLTIPPTPPVMDDLHQQLAPELALLRAVQADTELASEWLSGQPESEGQQLLRIVVCAAQWDLLSDLWEKLANRCKQEQRAANPDELHILRGTLALHNLRWQGRQAQLAEVAAGTAYDYERHQRGTPTGDSVRALWLPGLVNAGGQLHKKPLVQT